LKKRNHVEPTGAQEERKGILKRLPLLPLAPLGAIKFKSFLVLFFKKELLP
jgi:hypothetical protein